MQSPLISNVSAHVTHVNRSASVRFEALRVSNGKVIHAPDPEEVSKYILGSSGGAADLPLSVPIRAFRRQLASSAPEHECRKWTLYCSFDGFAEGQKAGPARWSVAAFYVRLPAALTAATPAMTPAATSDYAADPPASCTSPSCGVLDSTDSSRRTLGQLLEQFFGAETLKAHEWHAKLIFVLGEDEEEERKRKAELKAATVTKTTAGDSTTSKKKNRKQLAEETWDTNAMFGVPPNLGFVGVPSGGFGIPKSSIGGFEAPAFGFGAPAGGFTLPTHSGAFGTNTGFGSSNTGFGGRVGIPAFTPAQPAFGTPTQFFGGGFGAAPATSIFGTPFSGGCAPLPPPPPGGFGFT